jgi:TonB-linked SusC/RagA family outer membrane protein
MDQMKSKFNYTWLLLLVIVLTSQGIFAQTKITGNVKDVSGIIVPGTTVVQRGTQNGVLTDAQGNYSITLKEEGEKSLVFSFIGFLPQTVPYTRNSVINIILQEDKVELNEVVVLGYSTQKKSTLTGAIAPVNMESLNKQRIPNVAQALQGQVAGVQVAANSGLPGDLPTIRIRGEGTIGNNDPLYIIDGIPSRDISFLTSSDITSMTVLKDAASSAIYGSRASGGVVLITTKNGTPGKTNVNFNYFTGIHRAINLPKMLNGQQYMDVCEKSWNQSSGRTGTNPYTVDKGRTDLANTNWLDELFEMGKSNNIQFDVSGGNDKVKYFTSFGGYEQDGIVVFDNDKYQKLNFRNNINIAITNRFNVGSNLQLAYSKQSRVVATGESVIRFGLLKAPILSVYKDKDDPTYSERDPFTDMPFYTATGYDLGKMRTMYEMDGNGVAMAYFSNNKEYIYKTFGNVYGEYAFLKNKELKFKTNIGVNLGFIHNKAFGENYGDDDGGAADVDRNQGLGRMNRPNSLSEARHEECTTTFSNTLNYAKFLNEKHDVNVMIGTEYIRSTASYIGASRSRFPFTGESFRYLDYGGSTLNVSNSGTSLESTLFSYFGSASYAYDSKYMLTANVRADASSRFSDQNRWGYFPSVSVGWKLSNESFLKDVAWLSNLKLRGSWGKQGNQEIADYTSLTLVSSQDGIVKINRFGNPDLKWETSTQKNIGVDIGLLNNKLSIIAEYFAKNTADILLPISLPSVVGDVSPTILNAGEVSNKGFEFSLGIRNSERAFKYDVNLNFATLKNNVEKLHPNLPYIQTTYNRTESGHPLNSFYGYRMVGIYQNTAEITSYLHGTVNPSLSVKPGDIKFEDINQDGIINAKDRDFLGSPIPTFIYGIALAGSYKGFDLSVLLQGVNGNKKYNDGKKILDYDTRPFNHTTAVLAAWYGEGTSNTIPRVTFDDNGSSKVSSVFVEDASFLRLSNIELGYTLKSALGLKDDVRFYVSGQNLFTITKYTGLDPAASIVIDNGTYPAAQTFLFGVNIKF